MAAVAEKQKDILYVKMLGGFSMSFNGKTIADTKLVDGDYSFTITSDAGVTPAAEKNVTIKVRNGVVTEVEGDGTLEDGKAVVSGLPTGTYTVTENLTDAQTAKGITFLALLNSVLISVATSVAAASEEEEDLPEFLGSGLLLRR